MYNVNTQNIVTNMVMEPIKSCYNNRKSYLDIILSSWGNVILRNSKDIKTMEKYYVEVDSVHSYVSCTHATEYEISQKHKEIEVRLNWNKTF